jgi:carbon-monoxide dehydrogenase large subunit
VGEGGCIIGPPTLVNAIADALAPFGETPVDLPLTPDKILDIIEGRPVGRKARGHAAPSAAPVVEPEAAPSPAPSSPAPAAPAPAAAVDGMWKIAMAAPTGSQEMKGRFATKGEMLTGTLLSDMGDQDFTGTVVGDTLKWEMKITKPMAMTLKYDVKVEGDRLVGKVKMGMFGTAKLTGERL